jgi:hypothetical protein
VTTAIAPERKIAFEATGPQQHLMRIVREEKGLRIIGFGGGIRGTKTWGGLGTLLTLCRVFPRSRWVVVRKDLERLKKNTIPSFEKLMARTNGFVVSLNRTDWIATCANGSKILFVGENIEKDPELLRFHGFECNGFLAEEADELSERTLTKMIERAGAWIVPDGAQPDPLIICTFNPTPAWPKRKFFDPWVAGTIKAPFHFVPATAADNPYISDTQREAWKQMPDHEYKRFVEGDWSALTGRYYDRLRLEVHLIDRAQLPDHLPDHWTFWGANDWGYRHWNVFGQFCQDTDGTIVLLDSTWLRLQQDEDLAKAIKTEADPRCLAEVYGGHDMWAKPVARSGSGVSTFEVFAGHGINLVRADIDLVNGGRALNRALAFRMDEKGKLVQPPKLYIVRTPGNLRVTDQLAEIVPDENDIRKPAKIDANEHGEGGDDGADMLRYGVATRVPAGVEPKKPKDRWEPGRDGAVIGQGDEESGSWDEYMTELGAGF